MDSKTFNDHQKRIKKLAEKIDRIEDKKNKDEDDREALKSCKVEMNKLLDLCTAYVSKSTFSMVSLNTIKPFFLPSNRKSPPHSPQSPWKVSVLPKEVKSCVPPPPFYVFALQITQDFVFRFLPPQMREFWDKLW